MTTRHYLGIVEKDADSGYGMWFPDMPGCFPAAAAFDDLPRIAAEMLRLHIEALESNGRIVPPPRSVPKAKNDKSVRKAIGVRFTTILVPY